MPGAGRYCFVTDINVSCWCSSSLTTILKVCCQHHLHGWSFQRGIYLIMFQPLVCQQSIVILTVECTLLIVFYIFYNKKMHNKPTHCY